MADPVDRRAPRVGGIVGQWILALAAWFLAVSCHGQDIEPRRWSHLPIGANFGGIAYGYTTGDITLDPSLRIENGQFDLNTIGGRYTRSFELFGKSARVDVMQAYQSGKWTGLLNGVPARVERDGWTDTTLRFAVNLLGAPPLEGREFAEYRARTDSETIVGVGLALQLPTGQYFEDKLINLGSNRFTFRPQVGVVHNWGKWSAELTGATWFYTENGEFFNGNHLDQAPLFGGDAHLIYTFLPGLWIDAGLGYAGGGSTKINGVSSDDLESNLGWGLALGIPITRNFGVKISYIGIRTQSRTGINTDTLTCGLSVTW